MGAIIAVMMTGFAAVGVYKLFTKPDFRKGFFGELASSPVETTFMLAVCGCMLLCFWGVFIPALGLIKVPMFGKRYELWAVAGIASLVGFAIMVFYTWLKTPRR